MVQTTEEYRKREPTRRTGLSKKRSVDVSSELVEVNSLPDIHGGQVARERLV